MVKHIACVLWSLTVIAAARAAAASGQFMDWSRPVVGAARTHQIPSRTTTPRTEPLFGCAASGKPRQLEGGAAYGAVGSAAGVFIGFRRIFLLCLWRRGQAHAPHFGLILSSEWLPTKLVRVLDDRLRQVGPHIRAPAPHLREGFKHPRKVRACASLAIIFELQRRPRA